MPQPRRTGATKKSAQQEPAPSVPVQINTEDLAQLTAGRILVVTALAEAFAAETAAVTALRANIAMTPTGAYRKLLERHLGETQSHADQLSGRLDELGAHRSPLAAGYGAAQTVIAQAVALGKAPINLVRGRLGEDKLLKNAKDDCAVEALEIATYHAIEATAAAIGDLTTAKLVAAIRTQEERQLERLIRLVPNLAKDAVRASVLGDRSFDASSTGAAQDARELRDDAVEALSDARDSVRDRAQSAAAAVRSTAKEATERVEEAGASAAEQVEETASKVEDGARRAATGPDEEQLAIARYDSLKAADIIAKLPGLDAQQLAQIERYERRHDDRATVIRRVQALQRKS